MSASPILATSPPKERAPAKASAPKELWRHSTIAFLQSATPLSMVKQRNAGTWNAKAHPTGKLHDRG